MPTRGKRINSMEDWADHAVEVALAQDWVTRHETLQVFLKNKTLAQLIPPRLSPCQSICGTCTGRKAPEVIPLHEYCVLPAVTGPPLKQRKIFHFFWRMISL